MGQFFQLIFLVGIGISLLDFHHKVTAEETKNACSPVDIPYTGDAIPKALSALTNSASKNLFDGPPSVTEKKTSTKNTFPSLADMKYYNYYCAAADCLVGLTDMTCCQCKKFKGDLDAYELITDTIQDTLALVTLSKKRKEVAMTFRGSRSPQNILQDVTFNQIKTTTGNNTKLHNGFVLATETIYSKVITAVNSYLKKCEKCKVTISGHSLGGAMAIVAAFKVSLGKDLPKGTVYRLLAFAAPRVGNVGFVDYMNGLGIEAAIITANADIAPHLPPVDTKGLTENYLRILPEVWINGKTTVNCKTDKYEDPKCSNSMSPQYIAAHHIQYWEVPYLQCFNTTQAFLDSTILGTGSVVGKVSKTVQGVVSGVTGGGDSSSSGGTKSTSGKTGGKGIVSKIVKKIKGKSS